MQFQIPQFIEVENKIVGPLSLKQFLYLAAAGGISFILFFILATWLWVIITLILGSAAVSLAFVKYNGQPLHRIAWTALGFFWKPRLYLWQRRQKEKYCYPGDFGGNGKKKPAKFFFRSSLN